MENHLAEGCERCGQQMELLQRLANSASGLRGAPEVPEQVMERALAIFRPALPARTERHRLIASLIFDSFATPAPAGARGTRSGARRLSYRAENFELELLADLDRRSQTIAITGQLSDAVSPGASFASVRVQLVSGRKVLRQTATDEFGEFHLDSPIGKGLTLRLEATDTIIGIDVPLTPLWPTQRSKRGNHKQENESPPEPREQE